MVGQEEKIKPEAVYKYHTEISLKGNFGSGRETQSGIYQTNAKRRLGGIIGKSKNKKMQTWDGKWRVLVFDIPEDSRIARDRFRKLLKQHGFVKLQASVFINPFPLSREAIAYLQQLNLMRFIRIMKVEEMDNDADLRKKFNLRRPYNAIDLKTARRRLTIASLQAKIALCSSFTIL